MHGGRGKVLGSWFWGYHRLWRALNMGVKLLGVHGPSCPLLSRLHGRTPQCIGMQPFSNSSELRLAPIKALWWVPELSRWHRSRHQLTHTTETEILYHHPRAAVHWNATIFENIRDFDHILLHQKVNDDISNGSQVIVLTNKQTQTDTTENNTTSLRYRCAGGGNDLLETKNRNITM